MLRPFVRFSYISPSERILFIRTVATIFCFSIAVAIVPRRFILKRIGESGVETPQQNSEKEIVSASQVAKAIRRSVRVIPWRVTCFAKAIAAKYLLKQLGLASTLYLGVAKVGPKNLTAHAWLRCGTVIVTGKEEAVRFTPVVFFS